MRWAVWAAVLAGAAGGAGSARLAHAAELAAEGPRECADASEISFRVERSIGMPLSQAAPLRFDVVMERGSSGYVARIAVRGGPAGGAAMQRELVAADCGKLVDAVSVAVALALGAADTEGSGANAAAALAPSSDRALHRAPGADAAGSLPARSPELAETAEVSAARRRAFATSMPSPARDRRSEA